jgi:multisubunit Na+/H+ antiporter MnhB subunit
VGWVVALAIFLLILAIAEIVVGVHDAALARAGLGVAISSALLLLTGVLQAAAAYLLAQLSRRSKWNNRDRPPCKPLVLVALLVTILFGVYVFLSALKTPSGQRPLVVVVAAATVITAIVGLYVFGRDARVSLPRLGTIALGLVGTVIGAWQFWFQNQYVPAHAGRAVSLAVGLNLAGERKAYDIVRATVNYEAVGNSGVTVIGSTYTLTGSRIVRCQRAATTTTVQGVFMHFLADPQRSRYMANNWELQPATVLAAGKFVGDGKRLDLNVPSSRNLVFFVPRHRYQLVRLRAQLFAIPASVPLSQRTLPLFKTLTGDNELYGLWHIDDDSWLHDVVYGRERWVVLRYELVDPGNKRATKVSPDLRVTARFPNPTWSKRSLRDAQIEALFAAPLQTSDASEPFGDAELALEQVVNPSAGDNVPRACRPAQP